MICDCTGIEKDMELVVIDGVKFDHCVDCDYYEERDSHDIDADMDDDSTSSPLLPMPQPT